MAYLVLAYPNQLVHFPKLTNLADSIARCAWPDPDDHRTIAEFCENGAKAVADEATKKKITADFFTKHSVSELTQKSDEWLNAQGRLTSPMMLDEDSENYTTISWENAFDLIADELAELKNPNEAIFYTSGRTSNEAAFLWQLLARAFGTNNLPDCSNMCHESSGFALSDSIGIGKGTVKLEDFNSADLILVVGQNPGTNHPRMLTALRDAKKNGASVIFDKSPHRDWYEEVQTSTKPPRDARLRQINFRPAC